MNHLEERLLDHMQAWAPFPLAFWDHLRSIPQDMVLDV